MRTSFYLFSVIVLGFFSSACTKNSQKNLPRPNILFAIADDQSFPHAGAYGCTWVNTPAFDRVAKEGILFTNAFTPMSKCAPSRACIITGRNTWQLEEAANHNCFFPAKFKTYAEVLIENGYFVGHTAKGWAPGDPGTINGKKRELVGPAFNNYKTTPPTNGINKNDYAANFKDFLENKPVDQPFCFWYGSTEPHRHYEFKSGSKKGNKKLSEIDRIFEFWPDCDSVRHDILDYAFEIEYFDQHLAEMIQTLEEQGMLDNTIVVVTADNGMPFPRMKGMANMVSNHLPLAIMWPKGIKSPGRIVNDFVSFIDFAPTFLDLAKVSPLESGMQPMAGQSMVSLFNNISGGRDHMLFGKERTDVGRPNDWGYPVRAIVNHDYVYIRNFKPHRWPAGNPETGYTDNDASPTKTVIINDRRKNGTSKYWDENFGKRPEEELFSIKNDPECMVNLADNLKFKEVKEKLYRQMVEELRKEEDPRILGNGDVFDKYLYAPERVRNFYERFMNGENVKAGWINESDIEREWPVKNE